MLNNDILRLIFEACPLESCLVLGDVCKASSEVLASLDKTMVMQKVQDRAPWLELSTNYYSSWTRCARVLVARSRRARDGKHPNLKIVTNLHDVVVGSSVDVVSVEPTDVSQDDSLRRNMKPLFPYARLANLADCEDSVMEGTKVLCETQELDLTTMELRVGDYDPDDKLDPIRNRKPVSTAPSGLKVRHRDGVEVEVVAENKNLLQVQYHIGNTIAEIDEIVHKASQPRDEHGVLVIDPDMDVPRFQANYNGEVGMVNLAPGSGGALVIQHFNFDADKSCLGYIEPTPERRTIELCKLPHQFDGIGFEKVNQWFYVLHNGFLYLYFCGRFLQLWVDMDTTQKRALTVWNSDFPAVGPFGSFREQLVTWNLAQDDLGRFVTTEDACGCVVGDLETGKTYFARGSSKRPGPTIPFATEAKTVGFYELYEPVWEFIDDTMGCLYGSGENYDISLLYESFLEGCETKKEKPSEEEPSKEAAERELSDFVCYYPPKDDEYDYEEDEEEAGEEVGDVAERLEQLAV